MHTPSVGTKIKVLGFRQLYGVNDQVRQNYEFPPNNCTGQLALIVDGGPTDFTSQKKNINKKKVPRFFLSADH